MAKLCVVEECKKAVHARGYCTSHYCAWRRYGDPTVRKQKRNYCTIKGCSKAVNGRGLCPMHYRRWKLYGDALYAEKTSPGTWVGKTCIVDGCEAKVSGHGLCGLHLQRFRRHGDVDVSKRAANGTYGKTMCSRENCDVVAKTMGLCQKHYRQDNADRYALHAANRRAAKRQRSVGDISWTAMQEKFAYWGNKCWMCASSDRLTIDHVKPLSKGGWHVLANIRPACLSCNCSKNSKWSGVSRLQVFTTKAA